MNVFLKIEQKLLQCTAVNCLVILSGTLVMGKLYTVRLDKTNLGHL